jgi:predicted nucleotidyltransferase
VLAIKDVHAALNGIESNDVKVIYACEAGSRAWGFESTDSDWDVRFIYVRPAEWYLSPWIANSRDVIEETQGDLDIVGWDIQKALRLFAKCNPPLIEWLNSPTVYRAEFGFASKLRQLLPTYYSRTAMMHHYLHMAEGNSREYLQGDLVRLKKYLYVLRPLLCLRAIESDTTNRYIIPPVAFASLLHNAELHNDERDEIERLVEAKKSGKELARGPRIPVLSDFINRELDRFDHRLRLEGSDRHRISHKPLEALMGVVLAAQISAQILTASERWTR